MKKYFALKRDGFVSLYFLGILLYISTLSMIVIENDIHRMNAVMNLAENSHCFQQEKEAVLYLKCMFHGDHTDEEIIAGAPYPLEMHEDCAYFEIDGAYPELLEVYIDRRSFQILDFTSIRYS